MEIRTRKYEEMLPHEFFAELDRRPIAWMPCGLLEWHGKQNALGLDGLKVYEMCMRAANQAGGIVMPTLWVGLSKGKAKPDIIVKCFKKYMKASGLKVSAKEYRMNMEAKINLPEFRSDTEELLRAEVEYPLDEDYRLFDKEVLSVLEKKEQK
jgi:hypothetical protein